jgi:hypothetical protein
MFSQLKLIANELDDNEGSIWLGAKGSAEFQSSDSANNYAERIQSGIAVGAEMENPGVLDFFCLIRN